MTVRRASGTVKGMDRLHEILFSGSNGTIIRNIKTWDIVLSNVDWSNTITIADKNLWATAVYHYWDALSEANCGYYYQWWNNHGFPWEWSITTSSTQVNASSYWPWKYYNSSTFIICDYSTNWDSSNNTNLWWDTTNTDKARQWPSPDWYHIPSKNELQNLWSLVQSITWATTWKQLSEYCLLPIAGTRNSENGSASRGLYGFYWTSSPNLANFLTAGNLRIDTTTALINSDYARAGGFSIRPFKNA